jgi:flagellar biosynthesis chaperone FliJ
MAKIIEVNIPDEYKNSNRYEIYHDLEKVSMYAHKLKQDIEDLKGEIKLRDAQLQKQRSDILQLKSLIGHQKIEITDLKLQSEVEEAEWSEVTNKVPNFLPPSVQFEKVKGNIPK